MSVIVKWGWGQWGIGSGRLKIPSEGPSNCSRSVTSARLSFGCSTCNWTPRWMVDKLINFLIACHFLIFLSFFYSLAEIDCEINCETEVIPVSHFCWEKLLAMVLFSWASLLTSLHTSCFPNSLCFSVAPLLTTCLFSHYCFRALSWLLALFFLILFHLTIKLFWTLSLHLLYLLKFPGAPPTPNVSFPSFTFVFVSFCWL